MSDVIQVGPIGIRFRLHAEQSGGQATVFEFSVPSGSRVPLPHLHEAFDETIYGLDGALTWTVDGKSVRIGPGDALFIRRGLVHGFANQDDQSARQLSVITPGLLGPGYFRDMAEVLGAGGPPDPAKLAAVMQKHGLRPVMPS
jgi:quercetin dioxygenase-like cupin family protein